MDMRPHATCELSELWTMEGCEVHIKQCIGLQCDNRSFIATSCSAGTCSTCCVTAVSFKPEETTETWILLSLSTGSWVGKWYLGPPPSEWSSALMVMVTDSGNHIAYWKANISSWQEWTIDVFVSIGNMYSRGVLWKCKTERPQLVRSQQFKWLKVAKTEWCTQWRRTHQSDIAFLWNARR